MRNKKINKRIKVMKKVVIILFLILIIKLTDIQIFKHDYYFNKYISNLKYTYSLTAPRGKIYDRNGVLLVDNVFHKVIRYSGIDIISEEEEEISSKLSEILKEDKNKILDKMHNGYYFDFKTIKEDPTDYECAKISNLKGVVIDTTWKRDYKTDYFKSLLGTIGKIPIEKKEYFLKQGYSLNDVVGTSFIEEAYDDILKGEKDKYVLMNNKYELVSKGKPGNDIYLTIDIKLQEKVEKILIEEIKKAKKEKNTEYYDHSFVIVSDPNTGEILAMSGKKIVGDKIVDITPQILTTTIQGGSSVKGASHIVGYKTGALKIGETRNDFCIKLRGLNAKCSWRNFGVLNDLTALKYSSNSFQYQTAIKVGKGKYRYNGTLKLANNTLNIYRSIFNEFGLGVKTGIDLNESVGYLGAAKKPELILDFAVGQYDTYTPLQLNQYVNTIANDGYRLKPQLLKGYMIDNKFVSIKKEILNEISVDKKYIERVKKGFRMVMSGTGYNYIPKKYKPAGKTGTSTSYLDLNQDGIVETPATSNIFLGYAPYDKPIASLTVISPNVKLAYTNSNYKTSVNKKISYQVAQFLFEIYK